MNKPAAVSRAVAAIWLTFVLSAVCTVIDRLLGHLSPVAFLGNLILAMALTVVPYKIGQGRNWARYVYAVLTAFGFAMLAAGETGDATRLELALTWLTLPLDVWIVYSLFTRDATEWFESTD